VLFFVFFLLFLAFFPLPPTPLERGLIVLFFCLFLHFFSVFFLLLSSLEIFVPTPLQITKIKKHVSNWRVGTKDYGYGPPLVVLVIGPAPPRKERTKHF